MNAMTITDADLEGTRLSTMMLSITTSCNLRCTYCAVSQPWYVGEDLDLTLLNGLADDLARFGVGPIQVNGHGETSIVKGWEDICRNMLDTGLELCMTSNFARIFNPEELQVLARMSYIIVSIDTVDAELLRRIRRSVKLDTILTNMRNIRLMAQLMHLKEPYFVWQCTLSDVVAPHLEEYVRFGREFGVKKFSFGNLIGHMKLTEKNPLNVEHPAKMPFDELTSFTNMFARICNQLKDDNFHFSVQAGIVESIAESLKAQGRNEPMPYIPVLCE